MGYFTSMFVFQQDPQWDVISNTGKSMTIVASKHKSCQLGVIAFWLSKSGEPEYYFGGEMPNRKGSLAKELLQASPAASEQIERLIAAERVVQNDVITRPALEMGWLLHNALKIPLFFCAGHDEGLDLAFVIEGGTVTQFKAKGLDATVELVAGRVEITPVVEIINDDDEDEYEFDLDFSPLKKHPEIVVHSLKKVPESEMEARLPFSAALELWPKSWPEPEASLGLGTWDLLSNYPDEFETVFVRGNTNAKVTPIKLDPDQKGDGSAGK